jgi:hypothetical protein
MSINRSIETAKVKYQVAIDKNISESNFIWSRSNAMLLFNSLLITSIGFVYNTNSLSILRLLLPIIGLCSCFVWLQTTYRGFRWLNHFISSAREIERKYLKNTGENEKLNPIEYGKDHHDEIVGFGLSAEFGSYILIALITTIYFVPKKYKHEFKQPNYYQYQLKY